MWIIKPNYNKEHICYFCGENKAVPEKECSRILSKIIDKGKVTLSVSYIKVDIRIPRCEKCQKRHDIANRPSCFLFLIGIIIAIAYFVYQLFVNDHNVLSSDTTATTNNGDPTWLGTICVILGLLVTWTFVCFILGSFLRVVINSFMKGTKDEKDDDEYPPIKKLIGIGFMKEKPDAAKHHGRSIDNDEQKIQNTFRSINIDDNCIITGKDQG